jgi:hypothetical protein
MLFSALEPLIESSVKLPFYKLLRWVDSSLILWFDGKQTAMPTVDSYIELHAGPMFFLDARISKVLLQVTVASLYGVAVPGLYAVVFLAMLI